MFPDSSDEEAIPKGAWMRQKRAFLHVFQILVVRKQFQREYDVDQFLGCKWKFDDPGPETL